LPEAHLALASAAGTVYRGFDWEASLAGLDTAVTLDPNLELAHVGRARALYHLGLLDESRAAARASLELNPQSTVELDRVLLAGALFGSRFNEAAERAQRLARITDAPIVKNYSGQAQFYLNDRSEAIETLQGVMRGDQPDVRSQAALASILAASGRQQEAGRIATTLIAGSYMDHHVAYSLGATYAQLGQWTQAVKWLQTSAATGFPCYPWFAADPLLAPLRGRQDFQSLLSNVFARHEAARVKFASTSPSSSR
jgi:tetratricopeptide (TPR) repeat protein